MGERSCPYQAAQGLSYRDLGRCADGSCDNADNTARCNVSGAFPAQEYLKVMAAVREQVQTSEYSIDLCKLVVFSILNNMAILYHKDPIGSSNCA